ncbi:MAG TPA: hypothetical protein VES97_01635 [Solirubrobacteraceae bacterium]|nr:hypothetical protein [Solirubrobacteraceae bacterium]
MPETKTKRRPAPKASAAKKARTAPSRPPRSKVAVDRTTELSDEVLKSVEAGQRAALDAVRRFVDTVDEALPAHGNGGPSRREEIFDSAMQMADRLVHTQYEFLRKVVDSAGKSLRKPDDAK